MAHFYRQQMVPYTAQQMFELVEDIPAYSEFLPGCRKASVLTRKEEVTVAQLEVAKGPLKLAWTTRNFSHPGRQITMQLVDGPFKTLEGAWDFTPIDSQASQIALGLRYDLSDTFRAMAERLLFGQVVHSLVQAFINRAGELYG